MPQRVTSVGPKRLRANGRINHSRPHTGPKRNPQVREAILDSTTALLGEVGYNALTVEGVAARAGVGKATIYRWWATKPALVLDALLHWLKLEVAPSTGDVRKDFLAAVQDTVDTYSQTVAGIVIPALASELAHDPRLLEEFRTKLIQPRRAAFAQILDRATKDGKGGVSRSDLELVCDMVAGTVFYRVLISGEPITKSFAKRLTDLALSGIEHE
jgi:AcrR family transcriptional regulator